MSYDAIAIGGGLAGAALGFSLARAGRRVLVIEREEVFRDRVRGEYLEAWGVAEAHRLGLVDVLRACGAREVAFVENYIGTLLAVRNDIRETNPEGLAPLCLSHPALQDAVLAAAVAAGAELLRPATAIALTPGARPAVRVRCEDGREQTFGARLVVGADGRTSKARVWGDFEIARDTEKLALAGVLLDGFAGPDDVSTLFWNFAAGEQALLFPQGRERLRAYVAFHANGNPGRLSGSGHVPAFLAACHAAQVPAAWLERATPAGPLAAFSGADVYAPHPAREGIVLIGDAAASSDPTWGCGLSLTLRDVRVLSERLLASDDWDAAIHAYAEEHDRYYGRLHRIEGWLSQVFFDVGPEADARRNGVFARALADPRCIPDVVGQGPDAPCDEAARLRLFGADPD